MNKLAMFQQAFQQIMKSPNPKATLRSLLGNNNQAINMLNQIENMTPEQRKQELDKQCKQLGISAEQIGSFLGFK